MSRYSAAPTFASSGNGRAPSSYAPSTYYASGSSVASWTGHRYPAPSHAASAAPSVAINSHWKWADDSLSKRGIDHTGHSTYSSSQAPEYFYDVRGNAINIAECNPAHLRLLRQEKAKAEHRREHEAKVAAKAIREAQREARREAKREAKAERKEAERLAEIRRKSEEDQRRYLELNYGTPDWNHFRRAEALMARQRWDREQQILQVQQAQYYAAAAAAMNHPGYGWYM